MDDQRERLFLVIRPEWALPRPHHPSLELTVDLTTEVKTRGKMIQDHESLITYDRDADGPLGPGSGAFVSLGPKLATWLDTATVGQGWKLRALVFVRVQ